MRFYLFLIFFISWFQWYECKKISMKLKLDNDEILRQSQGLDLPKPPACGFSSVYNATNKPPSIRIVNGDVAPQYAWPWAAYVIFSYQTGVDDEGVAILTWSSCTGSIITRRHILTAAHCIKGTLSNVDKVGINVYILVGCNNVTKGVEDAKLGKSETECGQLIHECQHWTWGAYDPILGLNDAAIIELSRDISFEFSDVQPICLPTGDTYPVGNGYATGWGQEGYNPPGTFEFLTSPVLLQTVMPFTQKTKCIENFGNRANACTLCAGGLGRGTCSGDSGGPIVYQDKTGGWYQAGAVTGSFQCGAQNPDGTFNLSKYVRPSCPQMMQFIMSVLKPKDKSLICK